MSIRKEYYLELDSLKLNKPAQLDSGIFIRSVVEEDQELLARLMLDAFVDTIDYEGETLDETRHEVETFMKGSLVGPSILDCSLIAHNSSRILSACLISTWSERDYPWISYVMTAKNVKNQGLGYTVLLEGLSLLLTQGYSAVGAMITSGNIPSERLFTGLGFLPA